MIISSLIVLFIIKVSKKAIFTTPIQDEEGNLVTMSERVEENITQAGNPYIYIGPTILIIAFGTIANLLSLSYFITQRNFSRRKSRTEIINNRLFIVLNVFDILVCVFLLSMLLAVILDVFEGVVHDILTTAFTVAVQTTGFITCLLSVIRAISIIRPRHQLNVTLVVGTTLLYSGVMLYLNVKFVQKNITTTIIHFSIFTGLFIVVILSNILCIIKLAYSKVASWKREATITMGILSVVYCVFNIGFLVYYGLYLFGCGFGVLFCFSPILERTSLYIMLPMNSASNPVVYFLRNREMRRYLKNVWRKMTCRELEQDEIRGGDMTRSDISRGRSEMTEGTT